jgi:hypothetical protein
MGNTSITPKPKQSWGNCFAAILGFSPIIMIIYAVVSTTPPDPRTPEQKAAKATFIKTYCQTINVCKKYGTVRQECATAGSFKNCINVKMGDSASYSGLEMDCNNDGTIRWQPTDAPSMFECFFRTIGR